MISAKTLLACIFPTLHLGVFTGRHQGILLVLYISDEPFNLYVLARMLKIGKPPCSRIVGNLCERDFVSSVRAEDRRQVLISITDKGREFVEGMLRGKLPEGMFRVEQEAA